MKTSRTVFLPQPPLVSWGKKWSTVSDTLQMTEADSKNTGIIANRIYISMMSGYWIQLYTIVLSFLQENF